jgi:hypothetical protein
MKELGIYKTDTDEITRRVEECGLKDIFANIV